MKKNLWEFFTLSLRERRGTWILAVLLILISALNLYMARRRPAMVQSGVPAWMNDSAYLIRSPGAKPEENPEEETGETFMEIQEEVFFDPNTAALDELVRAGMGLRAANNLIRYRKAGGHLRSAGELQKIYGMDAAQFSRLEHHIRIHPPILVSTPLSVPVLELNSADSVALERLPGIGPVLARRIIRYREKLGGYSDPNQLAEVYGIPDSLVLQLVGRLRTDTALMVRLSLNKAVEKELASHPYIGKYKAAGIIRYRNRVYVIRNVDELVTNGVVEKNEVEKLRPYLVP